VKITNGSFSFDTRVIKFEGEFEGNKIMAAAHGWLGWHDHYLVIKDYRGCDAPAAADCHQMIARVWPIEARGFLLKGTSDGIEGDLAVYLFKRFLDRMITEKKPEAAHALLTAEFSNNFESLKASAQGLEILQQGDFHSKCVSSNVEACQKIAYELFASALKGDQENSYAYLGLGLLKLRDSLDAARRGGRITTVLGNLNEAARNLGAARVRSMFLTDFLSMQDNLAKFRLLDLIAFRVTPSFLNSITDYSRAYRAYVEADYSSQLVYSKRITDIPEELKSYIKGFDYEAKLDLATSPEEALPLLNELHELIAQARDTWLYYIVHGSQACRFGFHDLARESLENALNSARTDTALFYDTYVWQAYCLAAGGKPELAAARITGVLDFLADNEHSSTAVPWDKLQTVYIDLGYYFSSVKEYRSAADNFWKVIERHPCLWARVIHDRQLDAFRKSEEFMGLRENFAKLPAPSYKDCGV
jgi:tetratricopeptide (TPR) repeat protein